MGGMGEGGLQYSKKWASEDSELSPVEVTAKILKDSMQGVEDYLEFTVETCLDFVDGWLPTLDTKLKIEKVVAVTHPTGPQPPD